MPCGAGSSYRCQIYGDCQNHWFFRKFQYTRELEGLYCRNRSGIAWNRFSELCRWTFKKISSKIFHFFWSKKYFKKKLILVFLEKSMFFRKKSSFCRQNPSILQRKNWFCYQIWFFRNFFLKYFFDQKKWKIFDRIFFYELIQTSENRLAEVSERTTPVIKIKKKLPKKFAKFRTQS